MRFSTILETWIHRNMLENKPLGHADVKKLCRLSSLRLKVIDVVKHNQATIVVHGTASDNRRHNIYSPFHVSYLPSVMEDQLTLTPTVCAAGDVESYVQVMLNSLSANLHILGFEPVVITLPETTASLPTPRWAWSEFYEPTLFFLSEAQVHADKYIQDLQAALG